VEGIPVKTLVAGGTGFIGGEIVRQLVQAGHAVKVIVREKSNPRNIAGLDIERVTGDIRDKAAIQRALSGCDTFFLTAAYFSHWAPNPRLLYDVNVGGTRSSLQAALEAGVSKVVYTSTNNAIGAAAGETPVNEEKEFNYWHTGDHYSMSKYIAENEARIFAIKGLPVVLVNPTLVIGRGDLRPTPSGQMIIDVVNRDLPGYIDGGVNIVDVEDVARGHLLAAEKGRIGERYLLGNRNVSIRQYVAAIAKVAGVKAPKLKIPYHMAIALAKLFELQAAMTRKPPMVTASEVRIGRMKEWYDCSKAIGELGFSQTPMEETIRKAIQWFRENNYLRG
jgi:dihydroflavonol-4-reductase